MAAFWRLKGVVLNSWPLIDIQVVSRRESEMLSPSSSARRPSTAAPTFVWSRACARTGAPSSASSAISGARKRGSRLGRAGPADRLHRPFRRVLPGAARHRRGQCALRGAPHRHASAVRAVVGGERLPGGDVRACCRAGLLLRGRAGRLRRGASTASWSRARIAPVRTGWRTTPSPAPRNWRCTASTG